ncbi:MAG TPA: hypothetical protein VLW84_01855 [Terriglobales bacterium]|nr:hypothetical protein [Terriglobales bacterium]
MSANSKFISSKSRPHVLDRCFQSLHEVRDLAVFDAIERLVQAGEQAGFTPQDLCAMLNQGMTFSDVLDLIEARIARQ